MNRQAYGSGRVKGSPGTNEGIRQSLCFRTCRFDRSCKYMFVLAIVELSIFVSQGLDL